MQFCIFSHSLSSTHFSRGMLSTVRKYKTKLNNETKEESLKSFCSLQIWVLSFVLKSLTEEVWSHQPNMTVTTHAAVSIFFFLCFHSRSLQHTLHISWHTRFMCFWRHLLLWVYYWHVKDDRVFSDVFPRKKTSSYIRVNTVYRYGYTWQLYKMQRAIWALQEKSIKKITANQKCGRSISAASALNLQQQNRT